MYQYRIIVLLLLQLIFRMLSHIQHFHVGLTIS
nr:MAG TPA: hypothetical protein [Caudoviricetes sp.]